MLPKDNAHVEFLINHLDQNVPSAVLLRRMENHWEVIIMNLTDKDAPAYKSEAETAEGAIENVYKQLVQLEYEGKIK